MEKLKFKNKKIYGILMEKRGKKIILKPFFFFIIGIMLFALIIKGGLF
jgi:hypothetical protein